MSELSHWLIFLLIYIERRKYVCLANRAFFDESIGIDNRFAILIIENVKSKVENVLLGAPLTEFYFS